MRFIRLPGLAAVFLVLLAIPAATSSWAGTSFTVVAVDSGPPLLPYVQRIYTEPAHPTSRETTSVVLEGVFPYPCGTVIHRSNVPVSLELAPLPVRVDGGVPQRLRPIRLVSRPILEAPFLEGPTDLRCRREVSVREKYLQALLPSCASKPALVSKFKWTGATSVTGADAGFTASP